MTATQRHRLALLTTTATLGGIAMATTRSDGMRIITESATFSSALSHLGFLRLFAGHHIHILRMRHVNRIPAWITFSPVCTNSCQRMNFGLTRSAYFLVVRRRAPG